MYSALCGLGGFIVLMLIAMLFMFCMKVADQWDRVIVLRLGKFHVMQQPGLFWLVRRSSIPWPSGSTPACTPPT